MMLGPQAALGQLGLEHMHRTNLSLVLLLKTSEQTQREAGVSRSLWERNKPKFIDMSRGHTASPGRAEPGGQAG